MAEGDQARHESVTYCIGSGFIANTYGNGRSIRATEKDIGWQKLVSLVEWRFQKMGTKNPYFQLEE